MVFVFKGKEGALVKIIVAMCVMELFSRLSGLTNYYANRDELLTEQHYGVFKSTVNRFLFREFIVYGNLVIGVLAMKWVACDSKYRELYIRLVIGLDLLFICLAAFRLICFDSIFLTSTYTYLYSLSVSSVLFLLISLFHFRK